VVDSASKRNECQEYFLGGKGGQCVGMTTLPPSCANCLEIWESQPSGTPWPVIGLLYFNFFMHAILMCYCWSPIYSVNTDGNTAGAGTVVMQHQIM